MTISSSVLSAAGPNKYIRAPSTISPTITRGIKRAVCVTVIMVYSPAPIFLGLVGALGFFYFDPTRGSTGAINRAEPFRIDALATELASLAKRIA
jgi:hypothetical protein